ncbi:MAG: phytanoyl-CoA dioxygenase family protein, partial [Synechococcaceae cyanobacterium]|nr:phytanoyl-CoA dioxygenase family protein [Synechococcaceae cyanobacterium]
MSKAKSYADKLWTDWPIPDAQGHELLGIAPSLLRRWASDGFVVLPGAVPTAAIDRLLERFERIRQGAPPQPRMTCWHADGHYMGEFRDTLLAEKEAKVLDLHVLLEEATAVAFAPEIHRHLACAFQDEPLAFQSLFFWKGSEQGAHQDTAFVYTEPSPHFMAAWIALEDVQPGTGELFYYRGSHHLPDLL